MNFTIIILGTIVIILAYILYKYFSTSASTLSKQTSLTATNPQIPITENPQSVRYAYGIWVYVNTWNGLDHTLFSRLNSDSNSNSQNQIKVYLDQNSPTLFCNIAQKDKAGGACTGPITLTTNFPIQKWVYIVISVDNQYVDCYLDGKLIKSLQLGCLPATPPAAGAGNIVLGGVNPANNIDAFISGFQRWTTPLNPQEVWSNYMSGNGNTTNKLFSSYGMSVALSKDNVQQSQFNIF